MTKVSILAKLNLSLEDWQNENILEYYWRTEDAATMGA